jgi:hypothetical protein
MSQWDISDHPTFPICPLWRSEEAYRAVHQPLTRKWGQSMPQTPQRLPSVLDLARWLAGPARTALAPADIVTEYCERLLAAGVPLWRVRVGQRLANPLIGVWGVKWVRGAGARRTPCPTGSSRHAHTPAAPLSRSTRHEPASAAPFGTWIRPSTITCSSRWLLRAAQTTWPFLSYTAMAPFRGLLHNRQPTGFQPGGGGPHRGAEPVPGRGPGTGRDAAFQ